MGPKKGRPRKNSSVENSSASDKCKDVPIVPKAPRGRPAKKKLVLAPSTSSDCTLPSIENVPVVRKATRGRGRKKVRVTRDVLCNSNNDMQLRSQNFCNSGSLIPSASEGKVDPEAAQDPPPPAEPAPTCNAQESINSVDAPDDDPSSNNKQIINSIESLEEKLDKANIALIDKGLLSTPSSPLPKIDCKQVQPHNLNALDTLLDEPHICPMPFSPGDVPLKKRRLRDLVIRDQEGFITPGPVPSFVSPTSSAPSTPKTDPQSELPRKVIGAHVLFSGGLEQALYKAKACEYTAIGIFLKDLRKWIDSSDMNEEDINLYQKALKECGFSDASIVARGSYIINICSQDPTVLRASSECIVDDLKRCMQLDLLYYTIHLGEHGSSDTKETCIERVAEILNSIHKQTRTVITVLENTCGEENTIGGTLDDLKGIFDKIEDKSRIGFALDTCHLFSSGIDLREKGTFESLLKEFKDKVGIQYLKVIYVNDSGGDFNSHVDHHVSIGQGKIGLKFFESLVNDSNFVKVPLILETPIVKHEFDFKILNSLIH